MFQTTNLQFEHGETLDVIINKPIKLPACYHIAIVSFLGPPSPHWYPVVSTPFRLFVYSVFSPNLRGVMQPL